MGEIEFYIAHDTYPSSTYYEAKVEASPGKPALIYIGYDQDGEVFCNYKAINVTAEESEVEIEVEPGGELVVACGVFSVADQTLNYPLLELLIRY